MNYDERKIYMVARLCHQVNKTFCESLNDKSQVDWDDAPQWQRDSAIAGVRAHVESGLTLSPAESHNLWMLEKQKDGWTFGLVKNPDLKIHPCMMPYQYLPVHQRVKDDFFLTVVHTCFKPSSDVKKHNFKGKQNG